MDDCWEDPNQKGLEEDWDSSDEDYSPFLHLRYVSVSSCISG